MRRFFDAVADAHFIPNADGTVRFVPTRIEKTYLCLNESEADGLRLLWRPFVLLYILAGHAGLLVAFVEPWLGVPLLVLVWLGRFYLLRKIKLGFKREVRSDENPGLWINRQLAHSISRPVAVSVFVMGVAVAMTGFVGVSHVVQEQIPFYQPIGAFCLMCVGLHWITKFHGVITSQPASDSRARTEVPDDN